MPNKYIIAFFALLSVGAVQAQNKTAETDSLPAISLKTNLLSLSTTTLNLAIEVPLGEHWSIELPASYNPWTFRGGRKFKHWMVGPSVRYWTRGVLEGSFWGAHLHGGEYNIARIGDKSRYQGWLAGGGFSWGYRWRWSRNWGMEAEIGLGYAHLDYRRYDTSGGCTRCGSLVGRETKNYFGPTRLALSIVYTINKKSK
jgi:hypothetical protein